MPSFRVTDSDSENSGAEDNPEKESSESEESGEEEEMENKIEAKPALVKSGKKKRRTPVEEASPEITEITEKEQIETEWKKTEITFRFQNNLKKLSNTHNDLASVTACMTCDNLAISSNKDTNGRQKNEQLVSSVKLVRYANNFPLTLMMSLKGFDDSLTKSKCSSSGINGHATLYALNKSEQQESLVTKDSTRGIGFLKRYPGFTMSTIQEGIINLDENLCSVRRSHPVCAIIQGVMKKNGRDTNGGADGSPYVTIERSTVSHALAMLENDMKKHLPLVDFNNLGVSFMPAFVERTGNDLSVNWEEAAEAKKNGWNKDEKNLSRDYDCFVTLEITHTSV
jgi:hypothetical protein